MARSPAPSEPRAAASDPTASAARKASQRRRASGAAEARQRKRDKHRRPVRHDRCGARFCVKHPRPVQCGLAAPTPRPTITTTTRATPCCSCSPTPSSRPLHLRTSLRWTSSWRPYPLVSLWRFSPLRSKTGLDLNPIFRVTILDATSGSEPRPRLGFQATARVDVHLCRLPHLAFRSLEGSPQPERSWTLLRP